MTSTSNRSITIFDWRGVKIIGHMTLIGYLRSLDRGKTWERADGTPVSLPATRETVTLIDTEHKDLSNGSIAVDGTGTPYILYCTCPFYSLPSEAWIIWLDERGKWCRRSLAEELSKEWAGWSPGPVSTLHIAPDGRIFAALSLMNLEALSEDNWGHKSSEIIGLQAPNIGGKFTVELLSKPDMTVPHWFPNLERPTGHNHVGLPGVIYTAGIAGEGCHDILSNGVYWTEMQPH